MRGPGGRCSLRMLCYRERALAYGAARPDGRDSCGTMEQRDETCGGLSCSQAYLQRRASCGTH